jgi:uncharacterized protein (DUF169 family)
MTICEMLREAQTEDPFYAQKDNFTCAGEMITGMEEPPPMAASGQIGTLHGVYEDTRANIRLIQQVPKLPKNTVRYVVFSNIDQLSFDPDVFILVCPVNKAEIVFRAISYKTGNPWNSRSSIVVSCSWFYIHPYLTGEANTIVTGLGHGMRWRAVLPEGQMLISIPFVILSDVTRNLRKMDWTLKSHTMRKAEFIKWSTEERAKLADKE